MNKFLNKYKIDLDIIVIVFSFLFWIGLLSLIDYIESVEDEEVMVIILAFISGSFLAEAFLSKEKEVYVEGIGFKKMMIIMSMGIFLSCLIYFVDTKFVLTWYPVTILVGFFISAALMKIGILKTKT